MDEQTAAPADTVRRMILGFRTTCLLYVAAELGLADLLHDGTKGSAELATLTRTDADALHRFLRSLVQIGVLHSDEDGQFGLTPLGETLRADVPGSQRGLARLYGHEAFWRPWGDLLHTVRTGETAFGHVFGHTLFEHLTAEPKLVPIFNAGMAGSSPAVTDALVAAYDFGRFATIVDVGGGTGSLLTTILRAYPQPRGVIFDLPHSHDRAEEAILHAGLAGRCTFAGGDFFTAKLPEGDACVLKLILHDWDDGRSVAILKQCRRAIAPGGTLLVMEHVLPVGDEPALDAVMFDMTMLVIAGGRERSEAEYRRLFERAGFRLTRMVTTRSPLRIIEGALVS